MHCAQLARLVVVELDHRRRRVIPRAAVVVDLPLPVVVEDHGDPASLREREGVLHADTGKTGFLKVDRHQLSRGSVVPGPILKSARPRRFDSFMSTIPIVAVAST